MRELRFEIYLKNDTDYFEVIVETDVDHKEFAQEVFELDLGLLMGKLVTTGNAIFIPTENISALVAKGEDA